MRVNMYTVGSEVGQSCSFTLLVVTTLIDLMCADPSTVHTTSRSVWSTGSWPAHASFSGSERAPKQ